MESKQTAVQWLIDHIKSPDGFPYNTPEELFDQAKAMERKQIEDAYEIGFADAWDDARYDDEPKYATAEQYYTETFKSE